MAYTLDQLQSVLADKGYQFFDNGQRYNLNIIAVRNDNKTPDSFDDTLYLVYRDDSVQMQVHEFAVTTDPGLATLLNPVNAKGTAILVPNQYRGTHEIRKHQGKYDAVCQAKPVTVWRDNNKNNVLDFENAEEDTGVFGINIHRSNPRTESTIVGRWSAGCTVFKRVRDFYFFMKQAYKARETTGRYFSYTLLTKDEFRHFPATRSGLPGDDFEAPVQTKEQINAAAEIEALNAEFMEILDSLEDQDLARFLLAERDGLTETVEMLLNDLEACDDSPEKTQLLGELHQEKTQLAEALAWYKQQLASGAEMPPTATIIDFIRTRNDARHERLGSINERVALLEIK